jgi:hypothetical protein
MSSTTSFLFIKSFPSIKQAESIVSLFILIFLFWFTPQQISEQGPKRLHTKEC